MTTIEWVQDRVVTCVFGGIQGEQFLGCVCKVKGHVIKRCMCIHVCYCTCPSYSFIYRYPQCSLDRSLSRSVHPLGAIASAPLHILVTAPTGPCLKEDPPVDGVFLDMGSAMTAISMWHFAVRHGVCVPLLVLQKQAGGRGDKKSDLVI